LDTTTGSARKSRASRVEETSRARDAQLGQTQQQPAVLLRQRERTAGRRRVGDRRRDDAHQRRKVIPAQRAHHDRRQVPSPAPVARLCAPPTQGPPQQPFSRLLHPEPERPGEHIGRRRKTDPSATSRPPMNAVPGSAAQHCRAALEHFSHQGPALGVATRRHRARAQHARGDQPQPAVDEPGGRRANGHADSRAGADQTLPRRAVGRHRGGRDPRRTRHGTGRERCALLPRRPRAPRSRPRRKEPLRGKSLRTGRSTAPLRRRGSRRA